MWVLLPTSERHGPKCSKMNIPGPKSSKIQWQIQDFPDGGGQSLRLGQKILFDMSFAKNSMKMKEIGRGGHISQRPFGSTNEIYLDTENVRDSSVKMINSKLRSKVSHGTGKYLL